MIEDKRLWLLMDNREPREWEDFTVVQGTCEDEEYPLIKEIKDEDKWQGVSFKLWLKDGIRNEDFG